MPRKIWGLLWGCVCLGAGPGCTSAQGTPPGQTVLARLAREAQGTQAIAVGTVVEARAAFETTAFGDRIIVTRARVAIEETLQGQVSARTVEVATEGGTVGDLKLEVSHTPEPPRLGQRAVFFLRARQTQPGLWLTSEDALLELDGERVRGRDIELGDLRQLTRP